MSRAFDVDLLKVESSMVHPLVDKHIGELSFRIRNPAEVAVRELQLVVQEPPDVVAAFEIIPSSAHLRYRVPRLEPGAEDVRTYCLRPVSAEVGRSYRIQVEIEFEVARAYVSDGREEWERRRGAAEITVPVEARPEVYAAIGALEQMRESLQERYKQMVEKGRETQQSLGTALPGVSPTRPADVALSRGSFQFLMEALELGSKMLNIPVDRSRKES